MPLINTVSQLLEMSEGTVPEGFTGKIKKVLTPLKNKPGEDPYKFQKVVISDGANEIEMKIDDRDADIPQSAVGSIVTVLAGRGEKGLKGLKRKAYKCKPQIAVFDSAEISIAGNGTAPAASATPATPAPTGGNAQAPAQKQTQQAPPVAPKAEPEPVSHSANRAAEIKGFNAAVGKTCAALNRCYDAALNLTKEVKARHPDAKLEFSTTDIKEIASTIFIQACWGQKVAAIEDFPTNNFQRYDATGNIIANGNGNGHAAPAPGTREPLS